MPICIRLVYLGYVEMQLFNRAFQFASVGITNGLNVDVALCWSSTIEIILLEEGDVGIFVCTIIYHAMKKNAECCKMVEASRRNGYLEVDNQ